jgi:hypothetical protein
VWFVQNHCRDLRHGYDHLLRYLRAAQVVITSKPASFRRCYGPEFTRRAILKWACDNGVDLHYIDPSKPQQNGFIESFNGSLRPSRARKHALPGNGRAAERGNLRYVRRCPPQTGPLAIRLQQPLSGHCCAMPCRARVRPHSSLGNQTPAETPSHGLRCKPLPAMVERLSNLRAPRMTRLLKLTTKNMKSKPANSRYK